MQTREHVYYRPTMELRDERQFCPTCIATLFSTYPEAKVNIAQRLAVSFGKERAFTSDQETDDRIAGRTCEGSHEHFLVPGHGVEGSLQDSRVRDAVSLVDPDLLKPSRHATSWQPWQTVLEEELRKLDLLSLMADQVPLSSIKSLRGPRKQIALEEGDWLTKAEALLRVSARFFHRWNYNTLYLVRIEFGLPVFYALVLKVLASSLRLLDEQRRQLNGSELVRHEVSHQLAVLKAYFALRGEIEFLDAIKRAEAEFYLKLGDVFFYLPITKGRIREIQGDLMIIDHLGSEIGGLSPMSKSTGSLFQELEQRHYPRLDVSSDANLNQRFEAIKQDIGVGFEKASTLTLDFSELRSNMPFTRRSGSKTTLQK